MDGLKLIVLLCVAGLIFWFFQQPRVKWAPASGGSDLSVRLADEARYLQNDPRWAGQRLGGSNETLKQAGCAVASAAMAMTNLGYSIDPGQLSAALLAQDGFSQEGWLVWDAIGRVSKGSLRTEVHSEPSLDKLDACLARGDYPLVKFMIRGVIPHWVALVGKHRGTYFMRDPLIGEAAPSPLTRRTQAILSVRCIGRVRVAEGGR